MSIYCLMIFGNIWQLCEEKSEVWKIVASGTNGVPKIAALLE